MDLRGARVRVRVRVRARARARVTREGGYPRVTRELAPLVTQT